MLLIVENKNKTKNFIKTVIQLAYFNKVALRVSKKIKIII